jgi:hypothetical protein
MYALVMFTSISNCLRVLEMTGCPAESPVNLITTVLPFILLLLP